MNIRRRWLFAVLLLFTCLIVAACGKQEKKEEHPETTTEITTKEYELVSVNTDDSIWLGGQMFIGKTGSYLGFRDVEMEDWKSPKRAIDEGWVLQGGDRIHFGAEKISAFLSDCEAGIPGLLRIQRHFFGMEDTEEQVYLEDIFFDGSQYYYASLSDGGVNWEGTPYAAFQKQEVMNTDNALLITYFVLNDGSALSFNDMGELNMESDYIWVTSEYHYPVDTIASIYVNGKDYMTFDGDYTGFSSEMASDLADFYEKAHAKKDALVRVNEDGIRRDILFDGNKYYLVREDSGVIRTYLHSILLESESATYLILSASDGLTWDLYTEDPSNYEIYIVGKVR